MGRDAGIDVADDDGCGAVGDRPGRLDVDAGDEVVAAGIDAWRPQVPLAGDRPRGCHRRGQAVAVQWVVDRHRLHETPVVDLRPFHVRFGSESGGQLGRRHPAGHQQLRAFAQGAAVGEGEAEAAAQRAGGARAGARAGGGGRGDRPCGRQHRGPRLELDDDTRGAGGLGQVRRRPMDFRVLDADRDRANRGRDRDTQTDRTQQSTQACHRTLRKVGNAPRGKASYLLRV